VSTNVNSRRSIDALLHLTLNPESAEPLRYVADLSPAQRAEFIGIANRNHVVVRACNVIGSHAQRLGSEELKEWTRGVLAAESARIDNALEFLTSICRELESNGCPVCVLKSLDHTPDLGGDLDLFTTANEQAVITAMLKAFRAQVQPRSLGDCLANKWSFAIPGLREAVEVHVQRLGQAGEHTELAKRFIIRRRHKRVQKFIFFVPAPEETVLAATFQRMYRHFFLRVCDILNTATLIQDQQLDYAELKRKARAGGIWPGVATYLTLVADYVNRYSGTVLGIPEWISSAALFRSNKIFCRGPFLRIPLMPYVGMLYSLQLVQTTFAGHLSAALRLSLLPALFSLAAVHGKVTGKDQGVW